MRRAGAAAERLPADLAAGLSFSQLPALDGIRAVAAFLVVFYHFGVPRVSGNLGVLIFFVLSGFLITWLLLKEDEKFGSVSLRQFYARRALRIFPAFYCYWGLLMLLGLARNASIHWDQAIAALFYFNNYFQAIHGDPNTGLSHTWSLAIEEQFYLLWPMTFLAFRQNYFRLSRLLAGAVVAIWVYREVLHFVFHVPQGYIYEAFDTRADHLAMGCLLAVVLRAGIGGGFWRRMCTLKASAAAALLLTASTLLESRYGTPYRDTIGFVIEPVLVAVLIAQLIALRGTLAWAWLNWPWMRYLGRISYSVYLYQQITVGPAKKLLAAFPAFVQLGGTAAVVVLVASGSYFFIERPFLKWKDRFHRRAHTASAALPVRS